MVSPNPGRHKLKYIVESLFERSDIHLDTEDLEEANEKYKISDFKLMKKAHEIIKCEKI